MTLDEESYRIAGHAHLVGLPVRVHGRLESRGGFHAADRRLRGRTRTGGRGGAGPADEVPPGEPRLLRGGVQRGGLREGECGNRFAVGPVGSVRSPIARAHGMAPHPPCSQERPVSDVRVIIQRDSEREERTVTTGTTAAELFMRRALDHRRSRGRGAQGPGVRGEGRRGGRAGRDLLHRRPQHPAPLHRARHGAGRAGALPRGQARHRPAGQGRLLLRLRRRAAVHARGSQGHREEDAGDPEARPAFRAPRGHRRGRPRGAGERAVQARTHRYQGLRVHGRRRGRRGRRRRADDLRQPRRQDRRPVLEGPLPRSPPAHHAQHPGVQADAQRGRLLARQREEPHAPAHLRHRLASRRS